MKFYIITDLSDFENEKFASTVENQVNKMTDNPDFPAPPVRLTDFTPKLIRFRLYLQDPDNLSKNDRKDRNILRKEINEMYKRNAIYAVLLFPDDEMKQLSSGCPAVKPIVRLSGPPEKPTDLRVRRGEKKDEAIVNCDRKRGTVSLNILIEDIDTGEKRIVNSTSSRGVLIKGLIPGHAYKIYVQAVGAQGPSDYTDGADFYPG